MSSRGWITVALGMGLFLGALTLRARWAGTTLGSSVKTAVEQQRQSWKERATARSIARRLRSTPHEIETSRQTAVLDLNALPVGDYVLIANGSGRPTEQMALTLKTTSSDLITSRLTPSKPIPVRKKVFERDPSSGRFRTASLQATYSVRRPRLRQVQSPHERRFYWPAVGPSPLLLEPEPIFAELLTETDRVCVYREESRRDKNVDLPRAQEIARLLDTELLPAIEAEFGPITDLDRNGKLTVLMTPKLDELGTLERPVSGCVRRHDFDENLLPPDGNRAEIIYINTRSVPELDLRTLLAHELTHVVQFSRRRSSVTGELWPQQQDWISEGVAHRLERRLGGDDSNIRDRLAEFRRNPERSPVVVPDATAAGLFRHDGNRGAICDFFGYLESKFGDSVLTPLLTEEPIGPEAVELATGYPLQSLLRDWSVDLVQAADPGRSPAQVEWKIGERPLRVSVAGTGSTFVHFTIDKSTPKSALTIHSDTTVAPMLTLVPVD